MHGQRLIMSDMSFRQPNYPHLLLLLIFILQRPLITLLLKITHVHVNYFCHQTLRIRRSSVRIKYFKGVVCGNLKPYLLPKNWGNTYFSGLYDINIDVYLRLIRNLIQNKTYVDVKTISWESKTTRHENFKIIRQFKGNEFDLIEQD